MEQPAVRDIDTQFAEFIGRLAAAPGEPDADNLLRQAAARLSAAVGLGDVCLDLEEAFGAVAEDVAASLRESRLVGEPGEYKPLILDRHGRLYLYRYWQYEHDLAEAVNQMAAERPVFDEARLRDGLARFFGTVAADGVDWQRAAAAMAVRNRFSVISGGPGTGKTTTVVKIMALLLEQPGGEEQRIALAAPTGKAAARLKESIAGARQRLVEQSAVAALLPDDVATIHRLLGVVPRSSRFRHNSANRLPFEVVIVDEASMVPLPLMAKLVAALAPGARLILLGDRDQLSSVEAGAVLGDLCDTGRLHRFSEEFRCFIATVGGMAIESGVSQENAAPLADAIVMLRKNYRFGLESGIGALSLAVNAGDGERALELLQAGEYNDVVLKPTPAGRELRGALSGIVVECYRGYLQQQDPAAALAEFDRFRVLCATRQGDHGVAGVNMAIEASLAAAGLIAPRSVWYRGRPVMVTRNDYNLKLFNGDIGIALPDEGDPGQLAVYFPAPEGGVRRFSPARLPEHETVYAMTIHKSQGSEFGRILMILPNQESQLLTREIVYTGLTRTRTSAELWCQAEVLVQAVRRRITRRSGLRQALWGDAVPVPDQR